VQFYRPDIATGWFGFVLGGPQAGTATPLVDGTAAVGTSGLYARQDHVHPTDTSLYPAANPAGYQTAAQVMTALAPYAPLVGATFTGPVVVPSGTIDNTVIGGTTPAAAAVTTLSASGPITSTSTSGSLVGIVPNGFSGIYLGPSTVAAAVATPAAIRVIGDTVALHNRFVMDAFGVGSPAGSNFVGRSAGGTAAAPTATQGNTGIFNLSGQGYDGTVYAEAARIAMFTDGAWSSSNHGGFFRFTGTPNGSVAVPVEWMRLVRGHLLIGTTTDDGVNLLQVAGGAKATTLTATAMPTTDPGVAGELWLPPSGAVAVSGHPQVVGLVQSATVSLTSAQILALTTTPIQIIPAPGAGKMILMQGGYYESTFGTTPYTGDVAAYYGSGTATLFDGG
jgi:hypothetical protein